ncbi:MAG: hypothetical protein NT129_01450 [Candidatus Aenigmarchaeota archaeon]|nr:hypothetical protein [Candidatus Aenigmarchaeota archaeon]
MQMRERLAILGAAGLLLAGTAAGIVFGIKGHDKDSVYQGQNITINVYDKTGGQYSDDTLEEIVNILNSNNLDRETKETRIEKIYETYGDEVLLDAWKTYNNNTKNALGPFDIFKYDVIENLGKEFKVPETARDIAHIGTDAILEYYDPHDLRNSVAVLILYSAAAATGKEIKYEPWKYPNAVEDAKIYIPKDDSQPSSNEGTIDLGIGGIDVPKSWLSDRDNEENYVDEKTLEQLRERLERDEKN